MGCIPIGCCIIIIPELSIILGVPIILWCIPTVPVLLFIMPCRIPMLGAIAFGVCWSWFKDGLGLLGNKLSSDDRSILPRVCGLVGQPAPNPILIPDMPLGPNVPEALLENPDGLLFIELTVLPPVKPGELNVLLLLLNEETVFCWVEPILLKFEFMRVDVRSLTCDLLPVFTAGLGCTVLLEVDDIGDVRVCSDLNSFCCSCCWANLCFSSNDRFTCTVKFQCLQIVTTALHLSTPYPRVYYHEHYHEAIFH